MYIIVLPTCMCVYHQIAKTYKTKKHQLSRGKSVRDLSRDCENQERMVCKFKP